MMPPDNTLFDDDGYLLDASLWNEELAVRVAANLNIALTPAHWEVIGAVQRYYAHYELSPAMRPLVKYLARELGPDKGRSIYLLQLFRTTITTDSPAKVVARIAGLPQPDNCL